MSLTRWAVLAAAGSLALLVAVFGFQLFGYAPCKLCLWQRWPHGVAIALAVVIIMRPWPIMMLLGAAAVASSAAIGFYHTGVERGWFAGPDTCTSGDIGGLSAEQLMAQIMAAPLIRCDEVAWAFAGLSMASWNMVLSLVLAAAWLAGYRARDVANR